MSSMKFHQLYWDPAGGHPWLIFFFGVVLSNMPIFQMINDMISGIWVWTNQDLMNLLEWRFRFSLRSASGMEMMMSISAGYSQSLTRDNQGDYPVDSRGFRYQPSSISWGNTAKTEYFEWLIWHFFRKPSTIQAPMWSNDFDSSPNS